MGTLLHQEEAERPPGSSPQSRWLLSACLPLSGDGGGRRRAKSLVPAETAVGSLPCPYREICRWGGTQLRLPRFPDHTVPSGSWLSWVRVQRLGGQPAAVRKHPPAVWSPPCKSQTVLLRDRGAGLRPSRAVTPSVPHYRPLRPRPAGVWFQEAAGRPEGWGCWVSGTLPVPALAPGARRLQGVTEPPSAPPPELCPGGRAARRGGEGWRGRNAQRRRQRRDM